MCAPPSRHELPQTPTYATDCSGRSRTTFAINRSYPPDLKQALYSFQRVPCLGQLQMGIYWPAHVRFRNGNHEARGIGVGPSIFAARSSERMEAVLWRPGDTSQN